MLSNKPNSCVGCPAFEWGIGFIEPIGPTKPKIAFISQWPDESDIYANRPFHPNATFGGTVTSWLHAAHFQRCDVALGNIVQCWLPKMKVRGSGRGNRDPLLSEIQWCWNVHVGPWLHGLVDNFIPDPEISGTIETERFWVIPIGISVAKFLLSIPWSKGGERYAGTVTRCELPPILENKCPNPKQQIKF
jgi:hypothetical protein